MTSWIPIVTAALAGIFAVVGYLVQKRLERRQTLSDQRREAYTMYFKSFFQGIDNRREGKSSPMADEVYWKTRVLLFATDEVVVKLGLLQDMLTPNGPAEERLVEVPAAFNTVLLAMRREIVGKTGTTLEDVHRFSPLLSPPVE
ncbi:MAG: hypothetical protein A2Z25_05055 [Planctomycetes bacterium RBG_16_55_9]|nr:MAG: hypothetical protein A2Z25_05055 [Planctomycetes bacterium RBG_16_55_9]